MSTSMSPQQQPQQQPQPCMKLADEMSCDVMRYMAKDEVATNFQVYYASAYNPNAYLACAIADKQKELDLFAGNGLARNMCFNPSELQKGGEWEHQFELIRPVPECFNAYTRPR